MVLYLRSAVSPVDHDEEEQSPLQPRRSLSSRKPPESPKLYLTAVFFLILLSLLYLSNAKPPQVSDGAFKVDAMAMISMGNYCRRKMVEGLIESVDKYGHEGMKVFIITDRPNCFTSDLIGDVFKGPSSVNVVTVPSIDSIEDKVEKAMMSKSYKAKLFDLLPDEVSNVLYLDVDIRVTSRFQNWMTQIPKQIAKKSDWDIAFQEERPGFLSKFNSGLFYVERGRSEKCLKAWGDAILSGKYNKDQRAFRELNSGCESLVLFDYRSMAFLRDGLVPIRYLVGYRGKYSFYHFTHTSLYAGNSYACKNIPNCIKNWAVYTIYHSLGLYDEKNC